MDVCPGGMRQARSQHRANNDKPFVPRAQTAPGLVALAVTRCQEPGQRFPAERQRARAIPTRCSCGEQQSIITGAQRDKQLAGEARETFPRAACSQAEMDPLESIQGRVWQSGNDSLALGVEEFVKGKERWASQFWK